MPMPIWLLAIAIGVGFCIGAAGIGGILLIPALIASGLATHQAQSTALFTFVFTGICGAFLFQRRGSIEWSQAVPICAGAAAFSFLGAWVNSLIAVDVLNLVVAAILLAAGVYLFMPPTSSTGPQPKSPKQTLPLLMAIGAAAGFGSGLSGAGGPLFLVPIMLAAGFPPLNAIGSGQVLQVIAGVFGSLGNLRYGAIAFRSVGWLTAGELAGVFLGVHAAHRAKVLHLRTMVGILCVAAGATMAVRTLLTQ
jgi:uncharacterized membrane protein YfcA